MHGHGHTQLRWPLLAQYTASIKSWNSVSYQKLQEVRSKEQVALRCKALHCRERMAQDHVQQLLVPLCTDDTHAISTADMFYKCNEW